MIDRRKELGLSQQDIADLLKVTRSAVSGWELGRNEPDLEKIIKLKTILKVNEDDFFLNENGTKCDFGSETNKKVG